MIEVGPESAGRAARFHLAGADADDVGSILSPRLLSLCQSLQPLIRHGRTRCGHPRLGAQVRLKTWMAGASPAMTALYGLRRRFGRRVGLEPRVHAARIVLENLLAVGVADRRLVDVTLG